MSKETHLNPVTDASLSICPKTSICEKVDKMIMCFGAMMVTASASFTIFYGLGSM